MFDCLYTHRDDPSLICCFSCALLALSPPSHHAPLSHPLQSQRSAHPPGIRCPLLLRCCCDCARARFRLRSRRCSAAVLPPLPRSCHRSLSATAAQHKRTRGRAERGRLRRPPRELHALPAAFRWICGGRALRIRGAAAMVDAGGSSVVGSPVFLSVVCICVCSLPLRSLSLSLLARGFALRCAALQMRIRATSVRSPNLIPMSAPAWWVPPPAAMS